MFTITISGKPYNSVLFADDRPRKDELDVSIGHKFTYDEERKLLGELSAKLHLCEHAPFPQELIHFSLAETEFPEEVEAYFRTLRLRVASGGIHGDFPFFINAFTDPDNAKDLLLELNSFPEVCAVHNLILGISDKLDELAWQEEHDIR